ncbi:MAG: 2-hydroxyglutaryl-CoA dehydratase [Clostridia bacterium]|nr:2-hydroxyglutaryl-CoA dehydratase [Clostridia bacterium]
MLTMGVDVGSTSSKAVILRDGRDMVAKSLVALGTGTKGPGLVYEEALEKAGVSRAQVDMLIATGYGRQSFQGADKQISEVSCHAKGVFFLNPEVRTLIDIGGQDVKAMQIGDNGQLENFFMNDKCAAGTGRFLEVMARVLDLEVEKLGEISSQSTQEITISNTCTVFAESEVISRLSANVPITDILAGVHRSVAKRVAGLVGRVGIRPVVAMSGGVALNQGIIAALEAELRVPIYVPEDCQLAGAIGAAAYAFDSLMKSGR